MVDPKTPERPHHPASVPNPPLYYSDDSKAQPYSYHAGATPRSFKVSGTQQFTTPQAEKDRNQRYKTLARETRGHFVGPVNPAWFISRHLNIQEKIDGPTHSYPPFPHIVPKWTQLRKSMREAEMYDSIVSISTWFFLPSRSLGYRSRVPGCFSTLTPSNRAPSSIPTLPRILFVTIYRRTL